MTAPSATFRPTERLADLSHGVMFGAIALLIGGIPLLQQAGEAGVNLLKFLLTGLLLAGAFVAVPNRRAWALCAALAIPGLGASWLVDVLDSERVFDIALGFHATFMAIIAVLMLRSLLRRSRITPIAMVGALNVYLLIGLVWTLLYALIEGVSPGAFRFPDGVLHGDEPRMHRLSCMASYIYYSFITLMTIGFGDIVPVSPVARSVTVLEGLAGHFYMAVLIARFIGLSTPSPGEASGRTASNEIAS